MSYQQVRTTGQVHRLNEYIPNYQPHSEYLPTNRVLDANQPEAQKWLADYEQQKRLGHVYTQRPAEFNPARYVSVRTFENVILNAPIPETEFLSRVKKV